MTLFPQLSIRFSYSLIAAIALLILAWPLNAATALLLGIVCAFCVPLATLHPLQKWSALLIKIAIVGLGFGLPLQEIWQTTQTTWLATLVTISVALILGFALTRLLKIERDTGHLLSVGTAICGGSAIAAIAPIIHARSQAIIVAVTIVFLLNALALWLFPWAGHLLQLSPAQFGLWSALAIHDTSSVVGAAATFDPQALAIATTAKLARTIWIIPLAFFWALQQQRKNNTHWPWFIALFLLASVIRTAIPALADWSSTITSAAKQLFALALFGIGSQFNLTTLRQMSWRPVFMAMMLWLILAAVSLYMVMR